MDGEKRVVIGFIIFLTLVILFMMVIYIRGLRASRDLVEQELQTLQKATLFLLDDLYGDYLGELQYISIDSYEDEGRIKYLREQLQQIQSFVNTLDPERKAFDK